MKESHVNTCVYVLLQSNCFFLLAVQYVIVLAYSMQKLHWWMINVSYQIKEYSLEMDSNFSQTGETFSFEDGSDRRFQVFVIHVCWDKKILKWLGFI